MKQFNTRLFVALFVAGMAGAAGVIPYVFTTIGISQETAGVSIPTLVGFQLVQSAALIGLALYVGVLLHASVGLTTPYLEAWVQRKKKRGAWAMTGNAALTGVATSVVVILLDFVLFGTQISTSLSLSMVSPAWQRVLATLYGGLDEEILMRFFLLTFLAWLFARAGRRRGKPSDVTMWICIVLTALIFGVGHLPFASSFVPLSTEIVLRALLLNGVAGIVFGWLYWKRGLESAMIAHFASDVLLLVFLPWGMQLFVH